MRMKKPIILIAVSLLALAHRSDGQQARPIAEQLKLAATMPRGAMVYVQAGDLSALMKTWLASPVRSQFYDSASFAVFQKSHVYLKLQARRKDFETAIGVGLDERRLAELAGRVSAVSIYDIGKLEMVFVTEIPRARAVASTLFKQAAQFQERSADGSSYYVRDVATDGGRLNQQFCFAYIADKLIVTTTEGLMIRAIANAKGGTADSLSGDVVSLAEQAVGFAAHDVTMWLDQTRLNSNRYFGNYWIHHNADQLAKIESGLIDLRITREGMSEQRWFKMSGGGASAVSSISSEQIAGFMKFAPATAQLVEVHAAAGADTLASAIEHSLFGELPEESWSPVEIPDRTRSDEGEDEDEQTRAERYSRLDSRFDMDVDDPQAPKRGSGAEEQTSSKKDNSERSGSGFGKAVGASLANMSSTFCELVRSRSDAGKPFVRFERAIVAQLKPDATLNRETLERAIVDELRARFVVAGTEPRLEWQDDGAIRFVAQSLLEQGAAYAVARGYLVLASSKEFAADILQAAAITAPAAERIGASSDFYAVIRVAAAKPAFDTLMSKLDGRDQAKVSRATSDDEEREVKFFSENLSSLVSASGIREVRVTRQSGPIATEQVVYSW